MTPKVSVIIPTYNTEKYIAETLGSVLNQTYDDFEIIVVDDESKDSTITILEKYQENYPGKVRLIKKRNGGPASARNKGIEAAKGEYIAFNDADDLWVPTKLAKQISYFESCGPDVGMVYTDARKFDEEGVWTLPSNMQHRYMEGKVYKELLKSNFIPNQSVIVRKACFDVTGLMDESTDLISSEDYEMWLRIAGNFEIKFLDEILSLYREHSEGINKRADNAIKATIGVIEKQLRLFVGNDEMEQYITTLLAKRYYSAGYYYLRIGELNIARAKFKKSLSFKTSTKTKIMYLLSFLPHSALRLSNRIIKTARKPEGITKSRKAFKDLMASC